MCVCVCVCVLSTSSTLRTKATHENTIHSTCLKARMIFGVGGGGGGIDLFIYLYRSTQLPSSIESVTVVVFVVTLLQITVLWERFPVSH